MLELRGFSVLMFQNGYKALEMLKHIIHSIILSDIEMPGMDDFMLHEQIEVLYPDIRIPFQYISSTKREEIIERANVLSAHELVKKPVQADERTHILMKGINNLERHN